MNGIRTTTATATNATLANTSETMKEEGEEMSDEKTQEEIEADYKELKPMIDWLIDQDMENQEDDE